MNMIPLKTLKGSKIWYSKFGVGKQVGSKIYVHKDYALDIIPTDIWNDAESVMGNFEPDFKYNCVCWDKKLPHIVRFDEAQGFDTEREPVVGKICYVDTVMFPYTMKNLHSSSSLIWHHKWLWIDPDYQGFNVQESYEWSKLWLSKIPEPASGYVDKWKKQLDKYLGVK